jgi:hypothetical protein
VAIEHLVLIVGAGASRALGAAGRPMPLMTDWAETVRQALSKVDPALNEMIGLSSGQSGPEFERAIGEFLAFRRIVPTVARYLLTLCGTGPETACGRVDRAKWCTPTGSRGAH